jgi:hypothetical protein
MRRHERFLTDAEEESTASATEPTHLRLRHVVTRSRPGPAAMRAPAPVPTGWTRRFRSTSDGVGRCHDVAPASAVCTGLLARLLARTPSRALPSHGPHTLPEHRTTKRFKRRCTPLPSPFLARATRPSALPSSPAARTRTRPARTGSTTEGAPRVNGKASLRHKRQNRRLARRRQADWVL